MSYDKDALAEQLAEDADQLDRCGEDFGHWCENKPDGQSAYRDFCALSVGVPMPAFRDLSMDRLQVLFDYVQSQTAHKDAWTDYFVQSGLEAQECAHGDYLYEQERDRQLEGD